MTTEKAPAKATEKTPNNGEAGENVAGKAPAQPRKPVEATQDTSKTPKPSKTSHGNVRTEENKGEGIGEALPMKDDPTAHYPDFDQR